MKDEQKECYNTCVKISSISQQQLISECTKGQANNIKWFEERKIRLAASHFKEIVRRKAYPCDKLLKRLCLKTKPFTSKHTEWGKQAEPLALAQYKIKLESEGYKVTGRDLGLIVSPRYPYLGASPDWFVSLQKDGVVEHGLVEVKSLSKHAILLHYKLHQCLTAFTVLRMVKLYLILVMLITIKFNVSLLYARWIGVIWFSGPQVAWSAKGYIEI